MGLSCKFSLKPIHWKFLCRQMGDIDPSSRDSVAQIAGFMNCPLLLKMGTGIPAVYHHCPSSQTAPHFQTANIIYIDMVKSVLSHLCGSMPHYTRCLPNFPSEVTILLENTLHVPQLNTTFCQWNFTNLCLWNLHFPLVCLEIGASAPGWGLTRADPESFGGHQGAMRGWDMRIKWESYRIKWEPYRIIIYHNIS